MNAYYCIVSSELPVVIGGYRGLSTHSSSEITSSTCVAAAQLSSSLLLQPPFQELLIRILWLKTVRTSIVLKVVVHVVKI